MIEAELRPVKLTGSCLCGGVRYRIKGDVRGVVNCFCEQCRKTSGHHVAATRVNRENLYIEVQDTLRWYESSPGVERGFCSRCGGNLFWNNQQKNQQKNQQNNRISVMAGTLDLPTGLTTTQNVYEQGASDYFKLPEVSLV